MVQDVGRGWWVFCSASPAIALGLFDGMQLTSRRHGVKVMMGHETLLSKEVRGELGGLALALAERGAL